MKRVLVLVCILAVLLSFPALAVEDGTNFDSDSLSETGVEDSAVEDVQPDTPVVSADSTETEKEVTVNVTIQQPEASESSSDVAETPAEDIPVSVLDTSEDAAAYRTFTVISPDDVEAVQSVDGSTVMADVVVSVLGEYQRKTQTVQEMDSEGNILATSTEYVPGLAGLDYEWIAGAVLFALFLYGLLRMIGGLLKL